MVFFERKGINNIMIGKTGIWTEEEAWTHAFSYYTAKYIGDYFEKDKPVIDLGCGNGTYLKYLSDRGFSDVIGFEGNISSELDCKSVFEFDLTKHIDTLFHPGNLISIEVFEHIPKEYEATFVDNICALCNGKLVISVAVKGQPGLGHVNCQDNDYVINLFEGKGFVFEERRTQEIRSKVESHVEYLRNTLMVFER